MVLFGTAFLAAVVDIAADLRPAKSLAARSEFSTAKRENRNAGQRTLLREAIMAAALLETPSQTGPIAATYITHQAFTSSI